MVFLLVYINVKNCKYQKKIFKLYLFVGYDSATYNNAQLCSWAEDVFVSIDSADTVNRLVQNEKTVQTAHSQ